MTKPDIVVPDETWKPEYQKSLQKYHVVAAWIAITFDPVFAITDYYNIPDHWEHLLVIRLLVSCVTLITLILREKFSWSYSLVVIVPFMLISIQNAYTYQLIGTKDLLGHNLNYIALLIGAAMFLAWDVRLSLLAVAVSAMATIFFIRINERISFSEFFVNGGLLLVAVSIFMIVLIQTRYNLTVKELKARLALQFSKTEIEAQNKELQIKEETIRHINENLESLVMQRTIELEKKNRALEEYAFINAHKLRSPLASILGLINLVKKTEMNDEAKTIVALLDDSGRRLDQIVSSITRTIEKAE